MPNPALDNGAAQFFRYQLREARESAIRDAEAFDGVIFAIENLGRFLQPTANGLGRLRQCIVDIAKLSPLSFASEIHLRAVCTPFETLFNMVRDARNDAMHQGAHARHLTSHAIAMAIVLEDALATLMNQQVLSDFMIPNPVCAQLWQPVRFVRQQMLANSFTFLPVLDENNQWHLISDFSVASFIRNYPPSEKGRILSMPLADARNHGLALIRAVSYAASIRVDELETLDGEPILVTSPNYGNELIGIVTAFDLL